MVGASIWKVEDDESDGTKLSAAATLMDMSILDCPICFEPLNSPIFQCENGHIACSTCCPKLTNKCAVCKLPIGRIRNRVMESIIKSVMIPCPNAKIGCRKTFSYDQKLAHEDECVFSSCSCPEEECNYTGPYKDLYKHYDDHIVNSLLGYTHPFSCGNFVRKLVYFGASKYKPVVMVERKEGLLFVVQSFRESRGVYVTMSCIAPSSPIVGEFSCVISILDRSCSITCEFPRVKRVRTLMSSRIPEEDFMFIPSFILRGHQFFDLKICINKVDKKVN